MDLIQKALNTLEIAFLNGNISKDEIEKDRNASGLYSDTLYNRKKGRANQHYNKRGEAEGHFKGETSSGKKYDVRKPVDHEDHKDFTAQDHKEVAEHHKKMVESSHGEQKDYHRKQVEGHEKKREGDSHDGIEEKIKKVFPKGFDVTHNVNHGGVNIRGEREDNYWVNISQKKDGEYHIMMGEKGKEAGNAGISMNTFYNKTLTKEEVKEFNPENIIKKDKEGGEKIRKEFEEKYEKERSRVKENENRKRMIPIEEHRKNEDEFKDSLKSEKTAEGVDKKYKEISNNQKYIDMPANLQNYIADYADEVESKLKKENSKKEKKDDGFSDAVKFAMFPKTYTDKPKKKESYHKNDGIDIFRDVAMHAKDVKEFINKVRDIKGVPPDVAQKFADKYGKGGILSMEKTSQNFIDEVHY